MPYKDEARQKAAQAEHYRKNKTLYYERMSSRRIAHKRWLDELKTSVGCSMCGEKHPACLDFHHRDPATKHRTVSYMAGSSLHKLVMELEKCDVLCANCHRKRHYNERVNAKTQTATVSEHGVITASASPDAVATLAR